MPAYRGRVAPSPTGDFHLGNALAAVVAHARARRAGGVCLLRIEDLDVAREAPGAVDRIAHDLQWLGLQFDGATRVQSADTGRYAAACAQLRAQGLLYACKCSRKDLSRVASAPHEGEEGPAYRGTCRALGLPFDDPALPTSWRFVVPSGVTGIQDALQGSVAQDLAAEVGDVVVRRKDGVFAYQLAVVVDDAYQGITEVVRGVDLLSSAPRQAALHRALGHEPPHTAHLPMWVDAEGKKLSKRDHRAPALVCTLRAAGVSPGRVRGLIGEALNVCAAGEEIEMPKLAERLSDDVLRRKTITHPGLVLSTRASEHS